MDIKFLLNSDIKSILKKYNSKAILYNFLLHVIEDSKKYYNHKKNPEVFKTQDKVIELLGDLLLNKSVHKNELDAAAHAANAAAYAAANAAAHAANAAAYAAAHAENAAAYAAAHAAKAAAHAENAATHAATHAAAYAATHAATHAAAYAATHAANAAANAAAYASAHAADAITEQKYKHYLIELILKENNIPITSYKVLFVEKI